MGRPHVEEGHFSVSTHLISWPLVEIEFTFNFDQVSGGKEEGKFILPHCSGHRGVAAVLGLEGLPVLGLGVPWGKPRLSAPRAGPFLYPRAGGWLPAAPPRAGVGSVSWGTAPGASHLQFPEPVGHRSLRAGAGTAVLSGSSEGGRELSHRSCWGARETLLLFCVLKDERHVPPAF